MVVMVVDEHDIFYYGHKIITLCTQLKDQVSASICVFLHA